MNFWQGLKRPIKVLAPMAGYTDSAFRLLCRELGADVVVTELISADAIAFGKFKVEKKDGITKVMNSNGSFSSTGDLLSFNEKERPLVVQLFGKYPEKFAVAAKWVTQNLKPDGIDINMGCPARKVVGSDHGAALLKSPDLAVEIVRAVKSNTNLPVSVKTRLGWDRDDEILDFAPRLAAAGMNAIIIHGRTYRDGFSGEARWDNIYKVKELLGDDVVVIGNGDVNNLKFTDNDLRLRNLDGIAIGRASFGRPWIFGKISNDITQITELKNVILRHAKLSLLTKGERGMMEFRKHLLAYMKGFSNAKQLRQMAVRIETVDDIDKILNSIELKTLDKK